MQYLKNVTVRQLIYLRIEIFKPWYFTYMRHGFVSTESLHSMVAGHQQMLRDIMRCDILWYSGVSNYLHQIKSLWVINQKLMDGAQMSIHVKHSQWFIICLCDGWCGSLYGDFYNAWKIMHWFVQCPTFEKSTRIQAFTYLAVTMIKLQTHHKYEYLTYLNHMMWLFRKLLLTELNRIQSLIILNYIGNYRCIIHKTNIPNHFSFTHICIPMLFRFSDTKIIITS